jgi:hypothetical protein
VLVERGAERVAVIASDAAIPVVGTLSYRVPAAGGALHVVLDAPSDATGQSDVTAVRDGADCQLELTAHVAGGLGIAGKPLIVRVKEDCTVSDDGTQAPLEPDAGPGGLVMGNAGTPAGSATPNGAGGTPGSPLGAGDAEMAATVRGTTTGCSMSRGRQRRLPLTALGLFGLWLTRRRRAHGSRS